MTGNSHIMNCNFKIKFNCSSVTCYSVYYSADKSTNSTYSTILHSFKKKMIPLGVFVDFKQPLTSPSFMLQLSALFQRIYLR